jgi:hypothetical protein
LLGASKVSGLGLGHAGKQQEQKRALTLSFTYILLEYSLDNALLPIKGVN